MMWTFLNSPGHPWLAESHAWPHSPHPIPHLQSCCLPQHTAKLHPRHVCAELCCLLPALSPGAMQGHHLPGCVTSDCEKMSPMSAVIQQLAYRACNPAHATVQGAPPSRAVAWCPARLGDRTPWTCHEACSTHIFVKQPMWHVGHITSTSSITAKTLHPRIIHLGGGCSDWHCVGVILRVVG